METRNLIRRSRPGTDSRGANVELTDEGARMFRSSSASHLRLVRKLFVDALAPEDLVAAGRVAAKLRQHLNETNTRQ
jgi:DNA-binding MarR family transcriptional regulator